MSKRFLATLSEYKRHILPQENLSFAEKSPFKGINLPHNSFMAWHAPKFFDPRCQTGTAYVIRLISNIDLPIKIDVYQNYINGSLNDVEKSGPIWIGYHHGNNLPDFIEKALLNSKTEAEQRMHTRVRMHLLELKQNGIT